MGAAVRLEASVWTDPRFDRLARALGCDRDHAVMRMVRIWARCTEMGTYCLDVLDLAVYLQCDDDDVEHALCVKANLGEATPEGIRIRGTNGRIEWLGKLRNAAQQGGRVRAREATRNSSGAFVSKTTKLQPLTSHLPAMSPATHQPSASPTATATATATATEQFSPASGERLVVDEAWKVLGAELRKRRGRVKKTLAQLATALMPMGLTGRQVGAWERGEGKPEENMLDNWLATLARWEAEREEAKAAEPPSEHRTVIAAWSERWKKLHGQTPAINGEAGKHVRDLLELKSSEEIIRRMDIMIESVGAWPVNTTADISLRCLVRYFERFASSPSRKRSTVSNRSVHAADQHREF